MNRTVSILAMVALLALSLSAQFASSPTAGTLCGAKGTMPNGVQYEVICQDRTMLRQFGVPFTGDGWMTQVFMILPEKADAVRVTVDKARETWAEQYTHVVQDQSGRWMALAAFEGLHFDLDEIAVYSRIR